MPTVRDAVTNVFRSKSSSDLDKARDALGAAQVELGQVEQDFGSACLRVGIGEISEVDFAKVTEKRDAARARVQYMEIAVREAERLAAQAKQNAALRDYKSRVAGFNSRLSALQKEIGRWEDAQARAAELWRRVLLEAKACRTAIGDDPLMFDQFPAMQASRLVRYAEGHLALLSDRHGGDTSKASDLPGAANAAGVLGELPRSISAEVESWRPKMQENFAKYLSRLAGIASTGGSSPVTADGAAGGAPPSSPAEAPDADLQEDEGFKRALAEIQRSKNTPSAYKPSPFVAMPPAEPNSPRAYPGERGDTPAEETADTSAGEPIPQHVEE